MHLFIQAIGLLRAPLWVAAITALVLVLPSQTREILHAVFGSSSYLITLESVRTLAALLVLSATLLFSGLLLIQSAAASRRNAVIQYQNLLEAIVFGLALVPLLSVGVASLDPLALGAENDLTAGRIDLVARLVATAMVVAAVAFIAVSAPLRQRLLGLFVQPVKQLMDVRADRGLIVLSVAVAAVIALIVAFPREFADAIGPVAVLLLFFSFLCAICSLLTYVYDRYQIPVITVLVVAAITWSVLGTNNNHALRTVSANAGAMKDAKEAFKAWLTGRPDLDTFGARPYPVYLVSAEGGGLYAGAHAASVLARIQDNCPAFAQHLFAISGVSGGSLGSAVFAGLMKAFPPDRTLAAKDRCPLRDPEAGPLETAVNEYFQEDLLTPLLAATLFPDFLQRFLPAPVDAFDRARALEFSYEGSWKKIMTRLGNATSGSLFADSSRELWDATSDTPALLLNATVVQTGDRAIIAPFRLSDAHHFIDLSVDVLNEEEAVPLSAAVSASARFPLVTPPAVVGRGSSARQLVDGGYFENSGVQTAINLIESLKAPEDVATGPAGDAQLTADNRCSSSNLTVVALDAKRSVSVCFKLIVIKSHGSPPKYSNSGELLSPLATLYETRTARGRVTTQTAVNWFCGGSDCGYGKDAMMPHIYAHYLNYDGLPLGWLFSPETVARVTRPSPSLLDCAKRAQPEKSDQKAPQSQSLESLATEESACLFGRISADISPGG
ncbi:MAG: patatin-like phospholipase family protein [Hyphomicrobium sp.]|uniref:patatin-like phospholipase family protein n=1 Tax=Hyphomicrobium sp. TaxID=82 RepID=UPI003D12BA58